MRYRLTRAEIVDEVFGKDVKGKARIKDIEEFGDIYLLLDELMVDFVERVDEGELEGPVADWAETFVDIQFVDDLKPFAIETHRLAKTDRYIGNVDLLVRQLIKLIK